MQYFNTKLQAAKRAAAQAAAANIPHENMSDAGTFDGMITLIHQMICLNMFH